MGQQNTDIQITVYRPGWICIDVPDRERVFVRVADISCLRETGEQVVIFMRGVSWSIQVGEPDVLYKIETAIIQSGGWPDP